MNNFVCVNNAAISAMMLLQRTFMEQKNASRRDERDERDGRDGRDGRDRHDPSYLIFLNTDGDVDIDKIKETRIVNLRA